MVLDKLSALSPLDGRYASKLDELRMTFSEFGLIKQRFKVEVHWLIKLSDHPEIEEIHKLNDKQLQFLLDLIEHFSLDDAKRVKDIERTTNHDVKAIEYLLREKIIASGPGIDFLLPFIHFACTSEDINNLSYALMLKEARELSLLKNMQQIIDVLNTLSAANINTPMLARTHGQPASPTTLGKEFLNVEHRLKRQLEQFTQLPILGKFNGAVGNFNAHHSAYPNIDWPAVSEDFVTELGLEWNKFTTQIEPHDFIAEWMHCVERFNTILIDLNRDIWSYISNGYFKQKTVAGEVGSSTMPHKVNPIDFENSEGNLGLANAVAQHLGAKLPCSRWQRDLTDSTVMRNLGLVFGYSLLAYKAILKGLGKLEVNEQALANDLEQHWEVLGEAIQTVMRRYGITDAYEQLKEFTRGKPMNQAMLKEFINQLSLPEATKQQLLELTPARYIGLAAKL